MSHQPHRVSQPASVSQADSISHPLSDRQSESAGQGQLVRLQRAGPSSHPPPSLPLHLCLPASLGGKHAKLRCITVTV